MGIEVYTKSLLTTKVRSALVIRATDRVVGYQHKSGDNLNHASRRYAPGPLPTSSSMIPAHYIDTCIHVVANTEAFDPKLSDFAAHGKERRKDLQKSGGLQSSA